MQVQRVNNQQSFKSYICLNKLGAQSGKGISCVPDQEGSRIVKRIFTAFLEDPEINSSTFKTILDLLSKTLGLSVSKLKVPSGRYSVVRTLNPSTAAQEAVIKKINPARGESLIHLFLSA